MTDYRHEAIAGAKAVIVKVGTRVLTNPQGGLDATRIRLLADQLCRIADTGRQTILVSSGAVAAGVAKLGLPQRPQVIAKLQAVAAIGQADLIRAYDQALATHGRHAAQVLLTVGELRRRNAYLNVRNALRQIHQLGSIAIINENDSVAVAELQTTFGDNDRLAAAVSGLLPEALLVILSDVAGLYDGPPDQPSSRVLDIVPKIDASILALAVDKASGVSRGGMMSKLRAALQATSYGHPTIIAPGREDTVLDQIAASKSIGTLFLPGERTVRGRRRWIGSTAPVAGQLIIDDGAAKAISKQGASLLAVGIRAVKGKFLRGSVVSIHSLSGEEVARGLVNYRSEDILAIRGVASDQIPTILGRCPYECVIHRDNMAVTENGSPS